MSHTSSPFPSSREAAVAEPTNVTFSTLAFFFVAILLSVSVVMFLTSRCTRGLCRRRLLVEKGGGGEDLDLITQWLNTGQTTAR